MSQSRSILPLRRRDSSSDSSATAVHPVPPADGAPVAAPPLTSKTKLGADHVVNYRQTPAWGEAARRLTGGRGVDIVVEIGGAGTLAQSIQACRVSGHISLIGVLAGISGEVPVAAAFGRQLTIKGLAVGSREDQLAMIRGIDAAGIRPVVDSVYPLEALADAYRRQEAQLHFGKICVEI